MSAQHPRRDPCLFTTVSARATLLLVMGLVLWPLHAAAQSSEQSSEHRHALGGKVGTTGIGFEYSYSNEVLPMYGLRANMNFGSYSRNDTRSGILYEGTAKFSSLMLLADAHPYRNGFRLSAGLMVNRNTGEATGRPVEATFRINGVTYPASAAENVGGELRFQWPSPYFGVGWGAPPTGRATLFYSFDLGVIYQRSSLALSATCGPSLPAAECARLQSDLRAQEAKFRKDLIGYRLYPILTFGVGYRF